MKALFTAILSCAALGALAQPYPSKHTVLGEVMRAAGVKAQ